MTFHELLFVGLLVVVLLPFMVPAVINKIRNR